MLLISGRFGLVLVFFAVFLWFGRTRLTTLATLPIEALQLAAVLAFYGLAVIAVALVLRAARWMQQTIASMSEAELRQ
jgi:hypothetical protein